MCEGYFQLTKLSSNKLILIKIKKIFYLLFINKRILIFFFLVKEQIDIEA